MEKGTEAPNKLSFNALWLTEAIRLREEQAQPLEDSEASRQARKTGGSLQQRIVERAHWLARRDNLTQALKHWIQSAWLAFILLVGLALLSGCGLALSSLDNAEQTINIFHALIALLGLNSLMLLIWLIVLPMVSPTNGTLAQLWLWLTNSLSRRQEAMQLAPALLVVLQQHRLDRWLLGIITNGLWFSALLAALGCLLLMLATRHYGFTWETTILDGHTFVSITLTLGKPLTWLGIPIPDPNIILNSGYDNGSPQDPQAGILWSNWLIGSLLIYGLLPRLILGILCLLTWRMKIRRLQLDLSQPGYSRLHERLQPSQQPLGVVDQEQPPTVTFLTTTYPHGGSGAILTAIELDNLRQWPPSDIPPGIGVTDIVDSREQRRQLLEQLSLNPPQRLLIACDSRRSPDRGTTALIRELSHCALETRVWLLPPEDGLPADPDRLNDWQAIVQPLVPVYEEAPWSWLQESVGATP